VCDEDVQKVIDAAKSLQRSLHGRCRSLTKQLLVLACSQNTLACGRVTIGFSQFIYFVRSKWCYDAGVMISESE
jgi:hypothetical protein